MGAVSDLLFGTMDSWLVWNLSGGSVHVTDVSNASRTLLFDLRRQEWDEELLALFRVPRALLPVVLDSNARFGAVESGLLGGGITIGGFGA